MWKDIDFVWSSTSWTCLCEFSKYCNLFKIVLENHLLPPLHILICFLMRWSCLAVVNLGNSCRTSHQLGVSIRWSLPRVGEPRWTVAFKDCQQWILRSISGLKSGRLSIDIQWYSMPETVVFSMVCAYHTIWINLNASDIVFLSIWLSDHMYAHIMIPLVLFGVAAEMCSIEWWFHVMMHSQCRFYREKSETQIIIP